MKLKKCYVFSFGKLQDVTFDFSDGLNTFKEDNGWGKSTLATFIKCIFYGLNDSKKNVAENERLKYKTWNSTQRFGGYVEFEWGGKSFKLERYFGNKASEDTVSLVDISTGKSFLNTDNLGSRIFQIDEEGFLSTTYFSQKDFQIKSNTSLTAKFNSVCEIQDTEAFDKALSKLEEKAKTYKKTGDKGLIADTKREIFAVGEEIQNANLAGKTAESLEPTLKKLEQELVELTKESEDLAKKVAQAGRAEAVLIKREQYQTSLSKKVVKIQEKARLENLLNGQRPSEQELEAYFDCCKDLTSVTERENMIADDIQKLKEQSNEQPLKPNKTSLSNFFFIMLTVAVLLVVVGVAMLFIDLLWLSVVLFVLGACLGVVGVVINFYQKPKPTANANTNQDYIEQKIRDYNEYKNIRENYERNIDGFIAKFNLSMTDRFSCLTQILSAVKSLNQIESELVELEQVLSKLEQEKQFFSQVDQTQDIGELKKRLFNVQEEYKQKSNELARKRSDIRYYQEKADGLSDLEHKKSQLLLRQEQFKEEHAIILKTLEFMTKADENLKVKYRAPLQDSLNKYLSLITGAKKTANIDIDLNVTIEENGGAKQPDYYSKGEQNLFEICKRFALTDVLFTGEKPFIILDDPFYNLDDEKLKLSLELIKKLASEYQIIYFVCHESRRA